MTFANASLRAFLFFSFSFFLLPVIGNAQSPTPATPAEQAEAAACFQNLLDALIARDGTRAAKYVDQATFDRLRRLKLLALEGKPSEIKKLDTLEQIRVFKMRRIFTAEQLTAVPEWQLFADDALLDSPLTPTLRRLFLGAVTTDRDGLRAEVLFQSRSSKMRKFAVVRFSREQEALKCETEWLENQIEIYFWIASRFGVKFDPAFTDALVKAYSDHHTHLPDLWQPLRRRR